MARAHQQAVFNETNTDVVKLARGVSFSLVGKMIGRALHVLGQVTLARLLGPEGFGLYAIVWTMLRMAGLLATLGLDKGVIRYASLYWQKDSPRLKGVLLQSIGLAIFSGLLIGSSLYFAAPWLAEQVFRKPDLVHVIRWFSPAFLLYSGLKVAAAATRASQRMRFAVYAEEVTQPLANLLLILTFYLIGWGLFGAVAASVSSFGIALILSLYYVRHIFPEAFSPKINLTLVTRDLIAFSLPTSLAGTFSMSIVWVGQLLVGYFLPAGEVGVYQAISQSSIVFATILSAVGSIFAPMIADLYHKGETERLQELFKVSTKWGLYLSLPLFLVICFASREVITVVFGPRYESGSLPLVILATGQFIGVGIGAVGLLLVMSGHQNRWLLATATMLFASIALNVLLVPRLGLSGAALATACTLGGMFSLGLLQVKHCLGIWPYDRRYLKGLLAAMLATGTLMLLQRVDVDSPAVSLSLTLMISGGVFGIALLILGLDTEDQGFIRLIQTRWR